jgi:uncharacterized HhH-GPD family protein
MHVATSTEANEYLADNPFALLVGMLLDQQVPMKTAFTAPYLLRERLGHDFDAARIAAMDPMSLEGIFRQRPRCTASPRQWRNGCTRWRGPSLTGTTATPPRCG